MLDKFLTYAHDQFVSIHAYPIPPEAIQENLTYVYCNQN